MTKVVVNNKTGIHARPASQFVNKTKGFKSAIKIIKDGNEYDAKSIISVMTAMIGPGDEIGIHAEGEDAALAEKSVVEFVEQLTE